jgi:hypothetical protein
MKDTSEQILEKALESLRAHFSNGEHHHHVFACGDGYQSLYDIASAALVAMFTAPDNQVRMSAFVANNGEGKAINSIVNQGKALILQGLLAISKA